MRLSSLLRAMALACGLVLSPASLGMVANQAVALTMDDPAPVPNPAAPAGLGFGVSPVDGDETGRRALFSYGLPGGGAAVDKVAVLNYSKTPQMFEVYAADALNTADGGFALTAGDAQPEAMRLAAWVKLDIPGDRKVTVPGRDESGRPGKTVIPVTFEVPKDAPPGDHAAGIVAVVSTYGHNAKSQNIKLDQRVAARVYLNVQGPMTPRLETTITDVTYESGSAPWKPGAVRVSYRMTNTGNVRMGIKPSLTISGPFGASSQTAVVNPVPELLPGQQVQGEQVVEDVWPLGRMRAELSAEPMAAVASARPEIGTVSDSRSFWAFGWLWLGAAIVLVLVGLVVARIVSSRSGRTSSAQASQQTPDHESVGVG